MLVSRTDKELLFLKTKHQLKASGIPLSFSKKKKKCIYAIKVVV